MAFVWAVAGRQGGDGEGAQNQHGLQEPQRPYSGLRGTLEAVPTEVVVDVLQMLEPEGRGGGASSFPAYRVDIVYIILCNSYYMIYYAICHDIILLYCIHVSGKLCCT